MRKKPGEIEVGQITHSCGPDTKFGLILIDCKR